MEGCDANPDGSPSEYTIQRYENLVRGGAAFIDVEAITLQKESIARIWQLSLAQMLNIYRQRKAHRLQEWRQVCDAFVENTPYLFREIYNV